MLYPMRLEAASAGDSVCSPVKGHREVGNGSTCPNGRCPTWAIDQHIRRSCCVPLNCGSGPSGSAGGQPVERGWAGLDGTPCDGGFIGGPLGSGETAVCPAGSEAACGWRPAGGAGLG